MGVGRGRRVAPRRGHDVTALTLPGLESKDADRSGITFADHVDAIVAALRAAPSPAVLALHSATGFSGYAASDLVPERIAAMVYVDTAPGKGALDPAFEDVEKPMVWEEIEAEENLDGLSDEQLADVPRTRRSSSGQPDPRGPRVHERRSPGHSGDRHRDRLQRRGLPEVRPRGPGTGVPRRDSASCATSPGSTCPRAIGRCGRDRQTSPGSSGTSRPAPGPAT